MPLYDITLQMQSALANWPGDIPFSQTVQMEIEKGDSVNLSSIQLSLHTGTHADAPFHYDPTGKKIAEVNLSCYLGTAVVIDVSGLEIIPKEALLPHLVEVKRVLLRTNAWQDHTQFPENIPVLAPGVPDLLGEQGVLLLGLDVPSVDALDSKTLPNHHALGRNGVMIIESLDLRGVPEGTYELIALPLRLVEGDGSPIRAVLRSLP